MAWKLNLDGAHECLDDAHCVGGVVRRVFESGPRFVATTHLGARPYAWRVLGVYKRLGEAKRSVENRAIRDGGEG